MSLADLKFVVATVAGLAICLCLALWVLLAAFCWHTALNERNEQAAMDDFMGGSPWLLGALALSVAAHIWAQT